MNNEKIGAVLHLKVFVEKVRWRLKRRVGPFLLGKLNACLNFVGLQLVSKKRLLDYVLYPYSSYEDYRDTQIRYNLKKISNVFADEKTLLRVAAIVNESKPNPAFGICHGSRNGFEQKTLSGLLNCQVIGTDISPTASEFENSVCWDFHEVNESWKGSADFVYTNSLDQSWNPRAALETWLGQLSKDGVLIIEMTEGHGPTEASSMDPFGVKPTVFPYLLTQYFGSGVTIKHSIDEKYGAGSNRKAKNAWLFEIRNTQGSFDGGLNVGESDLG